MARKRLTAAQRRRVLAESQTVAEQQPMGLVARPRVDEVVAMQTAHGDNRLSLGEYTAARAMHILAPRKFGRLIRLGLEVTGAADADNPTLEEFIAALMVVIQFIMMWFQQPVEAE